MLIAVGPGSRGQRVAWSSSACSVMCTCQSIGDRKAGWLCPPHQCSPGLRGEEELTQNPVAFSVAAPGCSCALQPSSPSPGGWQQPVALVKLPHHRTSQLGACLGQVYLQVPNMNLAHAENFKGRVMKSVLPMGFQAHALFPAGPAAGWQMWGHMPVPWQWQERAQAVPRRRKSIKNLHVISSTFFPSSFLIHQAPSTGERGPITAILIAWTSPGSLCSGGTCFSPETCQVTRSPSSRRCIFLPSVTRN